MNLKQFIFVGGVAVLGAASVWAQDPTPTVARWQQRKDDMQRVGAESRRISEMLDLEDFAGIRESANIIRDVAIGMKVLYDYGMGDPQSNVDPAIFETERITEFKQATYLFENAAARMAQVAAQEGDIRAASVELFNQCKSCHERFMKKAP